MGWFSRGPRIEIVQRGRSGYVRYDEGDGHTYDFYWEFGGGDTVAMMTTPTPARWASELPWAADRRDQILLRIANVVRKEQCPSCAIRFTDNFIEFIGS